VTVTFLNMAKRPLSEIQSDLERREEELRVSNERLVTLRRELEQNEEFKRLAEFRNIFGHALAALLLEGDAPPLKTTPMDKVNTIIQHLKAWRNEAVSEALKQHTGAMEMEKVTAAAAVEVIDD
jgi:hypothetical protein